MDALYSLMLDVSERDGVVIVDFLSAMKTCLCAVVTGLSVYKVKPYKV